MSTPQEERPAKSVDDDLQAFPSGSAEEPALISVEIFGIKIKLPKPTLAEPQETPEEPLPTHRDWRSVWRDCIGSLQGSLVGLCSVLEAMPRNAVKLLNCAGFLGEAATELSRRIARGRARADHQEDERIAETEAIPASDEEMESLSKTEWVLARLEEWKSKTQLRGADVKAIETPEGQIIFMIVPQDAESAIVETARDKLIRYAQLNLLEANSDSAPRLLEALGLPTRIVTALKKAGFITTDQLSALSYASAAEIEGIGKKSLDTLRPFLKQV